MMYLAQLSDSLKVFLSIKGGGLLIKSVQLKRIKLHFTISFAYRHDLITCML